MASTFKTIGCGYNLKTGHPITFHMEHIRGYHLGSYKVGQTCPLTIDTEEPPPPHLPNIMAAILKPRDSKTSTTTDFSVGEGKDYGHSLSQRQKEMVRHAV